MRRVIWIVLVVAVLGTVAWRIMAQGRRAAAPPQESQVASVPVEVAPVATRNLVDTVTAGGTVEATEEVVVTSKIPGRVIWISGQEGSAVARGQVLARLDVSELVAQLRQAQTGVDAAQARLSLVLSGARPQEKAQVAAAVEQARANFEAAKVDYERMQTLYEAGAISKAQVDGAKLRMDVAQSQLDAARQQQSLVQTGARPEEVMMARAQLAQAQAVVSLIRVQLANAVITSPLSGILTHRAIDPGELAAPGVPLFVVANTTSVYAALDVSETDLGKIRTGQTVAIRVDSFPSRQFAGTVHDIAQAGDPRTRVFKVKVLVPNADRTLKPAMFVRGDITVGQTQGALVIPRDAVNADNGKPTVFVVEGGKAHLRTIQIGRTYGPLIRVLAGLKPGQLVVVSGQTGLTDGTAVSVQ